MIGVWIGIPGRRRKGGSSAPPLAADRVRVSQQQIDVIYQMPATVRVSHQYMEVVLFDSAAPAKMRVSQQYIEVVYLP